MALCDWLATLEWGGGLYKCLQCAHVGGHVMGKATMTFHDPFTIQRCMVFYMEKAVDLVINWYLKLHYNIEKK
jgi:hypothetical protein